MPSRTFTLFTDTVKGTESARKLHQHLRVVRHAIEENIDTSEGEYLEEQRGDEYKAVFTNPLHALHAALAVHQSTESLADGLSERIGIDDDTFEGSSNVEEYQAQARAYRVMQLCPYGSILCSETFINSLDMHTQSTIKAHGPTFVKLKSYPRPVAIYCIGDALTEDLKRWQTAGVETDIERELDVLGAIATYGTSLSLYAFRDTGLYRLSLPLLFLIHGVSKLLRWKLLEYHNSVNFADIYMLLYRCNSSLFWAERACTLAEQIKDRELKARSLYQKGHCLAHDNPTDEAFLILKASYDEFEELRQARMGAWAALFAGRCLRGIAEKVQDSGQRAEGEEYLSRAEDWILASCVISTARIVTSGWFRELRKRQMGYILVQLARLRTVQGRFADAAWYLRLAQVLDHRSVQQAPGDAKWDTPSIKKLVQQLKPYHNDPPARDTAYRIVDATTKYIL